MHGKTVEKMNKKKVSSQKQRRKNQKKSKLIKSQFCDSFALFGSFSINISLQFFFISFHFDIMMLNLVIIVASRMSYDLSCHINDDKTIIEIFNICFFFCFLIQLLNHKNPFGHDLYNFFHVLFEEKNNIKYST